MAPVVNLALIRVAGKMLAIAFVCVRLIYVVVCVLNQTTQYWQPGSTREHAESVYVGCQVYESHVD
jgi:hypothetical protein